MDLFEGDIVKLIPLAVFLPVVAGQSGNNGAQTLGVTMRVLKLRETGTSLWLRVAQKGIGSDLINGVVFTLITSFGLLVLSIVTDVVGLLTFHRIATLLPAMV